MPTEAAEKLARWASVGERDAPVAFVGREREIEFAAQQLETWRPGMSRGRTIVAQGAPGAGKTALLGEIEKRLPSVVAGAVSLYLPTPWVEEDVPSLLEDLAVRMVGADEDTCRASASRETAAGVEAAVAARRRALADPLPARVDGGGGRSNANSRPERIEPSQPCCSWTRFSASRTRRKRSNCSSASTTRGRFRCCWSAAGCPRPSPA